MVLPSQPSIQVHWGEWWEEVPRAGEELLCLLWPGRGCPSAAEVVFCQRPAEEASAWLSTPRRRQKPCSAGPWLPTPVVERPRLRPVGLAGCCRDPYSAWPLRLRARRRGSAGNPPTSQGGCSPVARSEPCLLQKGALAGRPVPA